MWKKAGIFTLAAPKIFADSMDLKSLQKAHSERLYNKVNLPSGKTHYQVLSEGEPVVLVHGVSGPLAVWDKNINALVEAGYKVIRYDLFGRGFSDRLQGSAYDLSVYVRQLEEFLNFLKINSKVRLKTIFARNIKSVLTMPNSVVNPN